ncbi:hypothetical protein ONZ45_g18939 [Pleurotus djamor]|nr:hypothetical protein ONZ45_g18939 [Pleurotus djamor]
MTSLPSYIDILIVGAGLSGIYQLHTFRKLGLSIKVVEAGKDLGGTWYWNCYPGARVDSSATMYQLEINELWKDWDYSVRFPDYKELRQYFDYADRKLGLRRDIAFNTRVVAAEFDEGRHEWKVTMQRGEVALRHSKGSATIHRCGPKKASI